MNHYSIDFQKITTKKDFHDYFVSIIEVPSYYGRNLDALYDVLTDLSTDTCFSFLHTETLNTEQKQILQVFSDAAEDSRHLTCEILH